MNELIILTIFIFSPVLPVLIRNIFHNTYIWQIKEYRVDRIISHLRFKEEESYRDKTLNTLQYGLFVAGIVFFLSPANAFLAIPLLAFTSYCIEALNVLQLAIGKKIRVPKKSIRNLIIVTCSFVVLSSFIFIPIKFVTDIYNSEDFKSQKETLNTQEISIEDFLIQENIQEESVKTVPLVFIILVGISTLMITADYSSPIIVSTFAIITEPLAQIKRKRLIGKAKSKIRNHSGFKAIGITGSYGKSTTKEILYELIKDNFKTAKTRENYNSTVGIAQEIIANLKKDTEVFIAEMGAYRRGEIKSSTNLLEPDISIITAIGPQHVSLFGGLENIIKAKYEIIEGLKPNGFAVFNANNEYCLSLAAKTDYRKILYYTIEEQEDGTPEIGSRQSDKAESDKQPISLLYAVDIKQIKGGFKFSLKKDTKAYPTQISILGRHNVSNTLAAVSAAFELGMDIPSIAAKLPHIRLSQSRLSWENGINNSMILDDSYNSNIQGFQAALSLLEQEHTEQTEKDKGKMILATKGLIELGQEKHTIYQELAKQIIKTINLIITSDKELIKAIRIVSPDLGEHDEEQIEIIYAHSTDDFYNSLINNIKKNDIILLEGRLPPILLEQISVNTK